jgi:serine acetyltransferase
LRAVHGLTALPVRLLTGVEIPVSARIGAGLSLEHYGNTIINGDAVIGRNATLGQGILVGGVHHRGVPRIGNDVVVGARAILLGPITVGDGAKVGAGAVVVRDVPAGMTVVGNPAKIVQPRER